MAATLAVQVMLGWLPVITGIGEGIHAFMARGWRGFLFELLSAALYLALGILLLVNPLEGALALTIVVAVFLIVEGMFKIITALRVRDHEGWGWLLASGIMSAILGVLIWAQWRASGVWVIGLLVGIQLLFTGWALVMLALAARRWRQTLAPDLRARRPGSAPRPGAPPAFGNRARLPALGPLSGVSFRKTRAL